MDQSSGSVFHLPGGCESESRVKHQVEECADMNYHLYEEISSKSLAASESDERSSEGNSNLQNIKQEHLSEQSDTSLDDSSEDMSDSEEFADLLQRCYSKSESDLTMQSADGDRETFGERSKEGNSMVADIKEKDESDSETSDFGSSVIQLTNAEKSTLLVSGEISSSQPPDNTAEHNSCPLCRKNFSRSRDLKRHIQCVHHIKAQHRCTQCEKLFDAKFDLSLHIKNVHGNKKYECDKCDYSSSYNHHLKRHISSIHLEEKPRKCPQCDVCFSKKSNLATHIRLVHIRGKSYECSSCDKKFSTRQHRDLHWKSVHCGEKPYSCDQCEYKFSQKWMLTRHQRTVHDLVKRYDCAHCEYKCGTKDYLKRHTIAVHYQLKPHSCSECGKAFTDKSSVRRHTDAIHRGLKPHACAECNCSFSRSSLLQKHIKTVHIKDGKNDLAL